MSARSRRTTWVLQAMGHDEFDVLKNSRRVLTAVPRATGMRYIRSHAGPGDRVQQEAEDGYREPL